MSDRQADRLLALSLLEQLCSGPTMQVIVIAGDPISKARPRFSKSGRTYTPTKTIKGEELIAWHFKQFPTFPSNVAVACVFRRSNRQRIDVDNLLKAVLDGGTRAGVWADDSQVTALVGIVEYDRDDPRTIVAIGEHASSLTRGDAAMVMCEACGSPFFPGGARREQARWCSIECRTVLAKPVVCVACEKPFKRRSGNQVYCSDACRHHGYSVKAAEARDARTRCARGHLLTPANTHVLADGRRRCRICNASDQRDRRAA